MYRFEQNKNQFYGIQVNHCNLDVPQYSNYAVLKLIILFLIDVIIFTIKIKQPLIDIMSTAIGNNHRHWVIQRLLKIILYFSAIWLTQILFISVYYYVIFNWIYYFPNNLRQPQSLLTWLIKNKNIFIIAIVVSSLLSIIWPKLTPEFTLICCDIILIILFWGTTYGVVWFWFAFLPLLGCIVRVLLMLFFKQYMSFIMVFMEFLKRNQQLLNQQLLNQEW